MPYTNVWSDTIPLGSASANTIDEAVRQVRLDVHERMQGVVQDWEADPVVPLASVGATIHGIGYDDDLSAGSKALGYVPVVSVLTINFLGSTSVGGLVVINLNEVNTFTTTTNWQVSNLFNPHGDPPIPVSFVGRESDGNIVFLEETTVNDGANTITLRLNTAVLGGTNVRFQITFAFLVAPV